MHIGFLTPEYPHKNLPAGGGLGTSIKNLAVNLVRNKLKVTVFVLGTAKNDQFQEEGIQFYLFKRKKIPGLTWYVTRKHYERKINKIALKENIDLLEAPDWTGLTAFMELKKPLLIRLHGSDAYFCTLEGRKQKKRNFWFEKNALQKADALVSVSRFTAEKTKEIFQLKKEIKVLPNGIDIGHFKPMALEEKPDTLLYFGTLIRKKGVLQLARAFSILKKKYPHLKLKLVGKDSTDVFENRPTSQLIFEQIKQEDWSSVKLISQLAYSKMAKTIAKAGVVVLPSFAEAMPMSWMEAMAMEKALVTSSIGWAQELMQEGVTGFMVNPKKPEEIATAVQKFLENPHLAKKMGENARNRIVAHFSSEIITRKNMEYYKLVKKLNGF